MAKHNDNPVAGDNDEDQINEKLEQTAHANWLHTSKPVSKVQAKVVKEQLWTPLEKDGFTHRALLQLEDSQALERYLWPGFNEDSSNQHVLLIALLINTKRRENLPVWALFTDRENQFAYLFHRFLTLSLDTTLAVVVRCRLLLVIIHAFQSLDNAIVRKECAPLVSIGIWQNLHNEEARDVIFEKNAQFKKAWKTAAKRYDTADDTSKARLRFDRLWLYSLLLDFLSIIHSADEPAEDTVVYCERIMELLCDLLSQFPTRRYVNTLLQDMNTLVAIKLSPLYRGEQYGLFRDFWNLLNHFICFPLDDHSGRQQSMKESSDLHCARLAKLQRTALKNFKSQLSLLALSNYGSLEKREEIQTHLQALSDAELEDLVAKLGFRTAYPASLGIKVDRNFLLEIMFIAHENPLAFRDVVKQMETLPTDEILHDKSFSRNESYNGYTPLAIPKLNLQYLSTGDFLWRSFILYRCETFHEVKNHIEETLKRLKPRRDPATAEIRFGGSSRMGLGIPKPAVVEVINPKVGEQIPAQVKAEVILDVSRLSDNVRLEWESLRPDDVVFLVDPSDASFKHLRSAEVLQVLDDYGRPLRQRANQANGYHSRPRQRRLLLKLDTNAYQADMNRKAKGKPDVYEHLNVLIRRRNRENNFKAILDSIQKLIISDVPAPSWLEGVFLGLGDPAGASYKNLPQALKSVDYRDTFLDWTHLLESLPNKTIRTTNEAEDKLEPPYVLKQASNSTSLPAEAPSKRRRGEDQADANTNSKPLANDKSVPKAASSSKSTKKRRRDEMEEITSSDIVEVSTYKPTNPGPYPTDEPKLNNIRFTPAQVEAITSGTQPGLTVIVGPPGTGKTDVATQIINNIYHDFPDERTLLIAHSNQALNQLFQKIVALDIDERHLLRLGHGESDLQLNKDASFSNFGRVESFMNMRSELLEEVDRLALSLNAPGAHGNSCETADYFNLVYIKPLWTEYWHRAQRSKISTAELVETFPFHVFFSNAPQPLFPAGANKAELLDISQGCYRHIEKVFAELGDIRPFEVLRHAKDKANYLLVKEARIIAMTSTHAAIRRQEIVNLGFSFDNVVMEEAAQVTEIENYIPWALQKTVDGDMPLKRIVLCGDHLQNSPIIQNQAFRQYANLEQSLFLRLVRLGVPTIMLDKQGRARSSIAELYRWRYPQLGNLPVVEIEPEFQRANAGLRYDYQFINVPDYKGRGEMEPTPHFIQNLGEAEYAVALYMYMRLLGYPASRVSILAMYAGQRALIRDVLNHRCAKNPLFGLPRTVTTVDQYQGEQNDYIILSMTRTSRIGYMRDIRRLTVALSRARLGFYVLGRRSILEASLELKEAFNLLFERPEKLSLVVDEMFPASSRNVNDEVEGVEMENVEHLGQYVFEMTRAKIANLKGGVESLPLPTDAEQRLREDEDEDVDEEAGDAIIAAVQDGEIDDDDPDGGVELPDANGDGGVAIDA